MTVSMLKRFTFVLSNTQKISAFLLLLFIISSSSFAAERDQAKRIHDRLAASPPSDAVLNSMEQKIINGDVIGAAMEAMENPGFYNVFLKNYITPWTNKDGTVFAPLNDYTASVIGMIRDEKGDVDGNGKIPFTEILTGNRVYIGLNTTAAYSHTNNDHYAELEDNNVDLSDEAEFGSVTQSGLNGSMLNASQTAGVLTSRAAGEAFLFAGTNRAMWEFTAKNHLCTEMLDLNDVTRTPDRIRQDVTRSPGGDSTIFLNSCVGCHAGMDPLVQAFAYYEWDQELGRVVFTDGVVQTKYTINNTTFPLGYVTKNDNWSNYWREGKNAAHGWNPTLNGSGSGVKSLGEEIASSRSFSTCQVKKAFKAICFREPANASDQDEINRIADVFENNDYSMKGVFAEVANFCKGS